MNGETIRYTGTDLLSRVRFDNDILYKAAISFEVDLNDVPVWGLDRFIKHVIAVSKKCQDIPGSTTKPFVEEESQTLNVAQGIKYIAVARMLRQFHTVKATTQEWMPQDQFHNASSSINLYAFDPRGIGILKANEWSVLKDAFKAIIDTNKFFNNS